MVKRIAVGCLVPLILLLACLGWLYQDVLGPGPSRRTEHLTRGAQLEVPPPIPQHVTPVQPAEVGPTALVRPEARILAVTERDANEQLRTRKEIREALDQANVSDLQLRFEPDLVVADARLPVWGKLKARVSVSGRVWIQDGHVAFETKSVRAGSLPAPRALREEIDRQLGAALAKLNRERQGELEAIQIRDGFLEIRVRN